MAAIDDWISDASTRMDKSVEAAKHELNTVAPAVRPPRCSIA